MLFNLKNFLVKLLDIILGFLLDSHLEIFLKFKSILAEDAVKVKGFCIVSYYLRYIYIYK